MTASTDLDLIHALGRPEAFPQPVTDVEVHQTHISAVFLGGETAYKIKKPINLGFLDFTTLERRRHFCEEETRINRRLAPRVYQGVVPVAETPAGLRFEAPGPVVEWAVKMMRMPVERCLEVRIERNEIDAPILRSLARRIAAFHRGAATSQDIAACARWRVVADNALDNLHAARKHIGQTIHPDVLERLTFRTGRALEELRPVIERRAEHGVPRDTHGDLRVDHVYWYPELAPPEDWCILDGIEFNNAYRYADPVADMAFLTMDLAFRGRWDLARSFADAYFEAADDAAGRSLLPLYASYRAAVRAKVEGILQDEVEVPKATRYKALRQARAHWLAALTWLEPQATRPQLILIGGLPGSGKSTLAQRLAEWSGAVLLRSDVVRKELAGVADTSARAPFGEGIYTEAWNERTLGELERRAERALWVGRPVCVDASLRQDAHRRRLLDLARRWGVPALFLHCEVAPETARERLRQRQGGPSDADDSIHAIAAQLWQPVSPPVARATRVIHADRPVEDVVRQATRILDE